MNWQARFELYIFLCGIGAGVSLYAASCAHVKPIARTVDDAAHILCELFAAEHQDQVALSPEDFCAVERNLRPFIDRALAAKQAAGTVALQQQSQ